MTSFTMYITSIYLEHIHNYIKISLLYVIYISFRCIDTKHQLPILPIDAFRITPKIA